MGVMTFCLGIGRVGLTENMPFGEHNSITITTVLSLSSETVDEPKSQRSFSSRDALFLGNSPRIQFIEILSCCIN